MDDQDPTPWEDINPRSTGSVPTPVPRSTSLEPWRDPKTALEPASREVFRRELVGCLALVAPAGMDSATRREWLASAWGTLREYPADLIERGCNHARRVADHPAKIVPAILAEVEDALKTRQRNRLDLIETRPPSQGLVTAKRHVMDRRGEPMTEEETAELNTELERLGATARYRPDGSRYLITIQTGG